MSSRRGVMEDAVAIVARGPICYRVLEVRPVIDAPLVVHVRDLDVWATIWTIVQAALHLGLRFARLRADQTTTPTHTPDVNESKLLARNLDGLAVVDSDELL